MPDRDGSGPRRLGKRKLGKGSGNAGKECRKNDKTLGNRSRGQDRLLGQNQANSRKSLISPETSKSIAMHLLRLATAAIPIIVKIKKVLSSENQERISPPQNPTSKNITVEPKTLLADENDEGKKG